MELDKDFKEFIELLNAHDVQYLVIGEYAVNFHGYPRYTKNIDFWLWMTDENIEKLLQVIKSFGFGSLGLDKNDFSDADNIIQLGYESYRIDLLMDVNGVDFQECYNRRIDGEIETVKVKFLSIDDLIVAKKNAGKLQDLADAEQLEKLRNKK
jgi:predicted nucleotidyltransferase